MTSTPAPSSPGSVRAGDPDRTALVTGATGYIGGALVPRLLAAGWRVRVLTRRAGSLTTRPWAGDVEIVEGDATDPATLDRAMAGAGVAYYLIHSMAGGRDFAERDRELAERFAAAAERAGVGRIVYLGGLHPEGADLSPHLASRVEVGQVFLDSPVPAAVLQAAVILGDGSTSFDMLRYLTTRLPAMIAPKWLETRIQPIAIDDVLHLLVAAADLPAELDRTFDVGGPEVLTYRQMIQRYAAVTGLRRRWVVGVPVLTPHLASHWVGLVTPISADVAKPLVGSLVHEVVCQEQDLRALVGDLPGGPTDFDTAVRKALATAPPDHWWRWVGATGAAVAAVAVAAAIGVRRRRG